jgi:hypothetical protein
MSRRHASINRRRCALLVAGHLCLLLALSSCQSSSEKRQRGEERRRQVSLTHERTSDSTVPPSGISGIEVTETSAPPAFSIEAAVAYVESRPFPTSLARGKVSVVRAEFTVAADAEKLLNVRIGLPGDALLCLVSVVGEFDMRQPVGSFVRYGEGYQLFDGRTGALLMFGTRGKGEPVGGVGPR